MASVNIGSIERKIKTYAKTDSGKKKMNSFIKGKNGVDMVKYNGKLIPADEFMYMVAEDFYDELLSIAYGELSLPEQKSVRENIAATTVSGRPEIIGEYSGDGHLWSIDIAIGGTDKAALYRNSFRVRSNSEKRTGDGIDNIIAMFNNGVKADGAVFGNWDGHGHDGYWSERTRPTLKFVQEASMVVVEKYKSMGYYIEIEISGEYNKDGKEDTIS